MGTERKRKRPFSISLHESDLEEIREHLIDFRDETGIEISRNELIRRAVLAHVRYRKAWKERQDLSKPDEGKDYDSIFKSIK